MILSDSEEFYNILELFLVRLIWVQTKTWPLLTIYASDIVLVFADIICFELIYYFE